MSFGPKARVSPSQRTSTDPAAAMAESSDPEHIGAGGKDRIERNDADDPGHDGARRRSADIGRAPAGAEAHPAAGECDEGAKADALRKPDIKLGRVDRTAELPQEYRGRDVQHGD